MSIFRTSLFPHYKHLVSAVNAVGGAGAMELGTMRVVARRGVVQFTLVPQFIVRETNGGLTYSMTYGEDIAGFAGWLPYFNKQWDEARDKLVFKRRCQHVGLPTPRWCTTLDASALDSDYVLKRAKGSFGREVTGPFRADVRLKAPLPEGAYLEALVLGRIGKAWYWNDAVVAVELAPLPVLVGDGHADLLTLAQRVRPGFDQEGLKGWFRYRGLSWDGVPALGQTVEVDYKYGSPLYPLTWQSLNVWPEGVDVPIRDQLAGWGGQFYSWIPEALRPGVLYTVDFVVDAAGAIGLLEMNCNPTVAPEAYGRIVADAFAHVDTPSMYWGLGALGVVAP